MLRSSTVSYSRHDGARSALLHPSVCCRRARQVSMLAQSGAEGLPPSLPLGDSSDVPASAPGKAGLGDRLKNFFRGSTIDKQRLAALGFGAFAAYGVISNINAGKDQGPMGLSLCVAGVAGSSAPCACRMAHPRRFHAWTPAAGKVCGTHQPVHQTVWFAPHLLVWCMRRTRRTHRTIGWHACASRRTCTHARQGLWWAVVHPRAALRCSPLLRLPLGILITLAWIAIVKQYGLTPMDAGMWPQFLAVYAGLWVSSHFLR